MLRDVPIAAAGRVPAPDGTKARHPGAARGSDAAALASFLGRHARIAVLTGAGCSTGSGIPAYRDDDGNWQHRRPVQYADFVARADVRRRYWAQSLYGWPRVAAAMPNAAHAALARLETRGRITGVITQNVDDLHRRAGSRNVVDLHGRLSRVRCLQCRSTTPRSGFQAILEGRNPDWHALATARAPDGDSVLAEADFERFDVPACAACNGIVKPDVVFFGEAVPVARVARASEILAASDALLVVGSSLMVFSGFRFARMAHAAGLPIAIVNRGVTRADALASLRVAVDCAAVLAECLATDAA